MANRDVIRPSDARWPIPADGEGDDGLSIRQLTLKSQEAVQKAQALARERGHQRLEPMHLLAALLDPDQAVVRSLLSQLGVNPAQILQGGRGGAERRCPRSPAARRRSAPT